VTGKEYGCDRGHAKQKTGEEKIIGSAGWYVRASPHKSRDKPKKGILESQHSTKLHPRAALQRGKGCWDISPSGLPQGRPPLAKALAVHPICPTCGAGSCVPAVTCSCQHHPEDLKIGQLYVAPVHCAGEADLCHSRGKVLLQVLHCSIQMVSLQGTAAAAACCYMQCGHRRPRGRVKAAFQKWTYFASVLPTF